MQAPIKLYVSGITTADAVLTYTFPRRSRLVALTAMCQLTVAAAATESLQWEISQQSVNQFTQNEAQGVIAEVGIQASVGTAGKIDRGIFNLGGFDFSFDAGSKLYVHRLQNSAPSAAILQLALYII